MQKKTDSFFQNCYYCFSYSCLRPNVCNNVCSWTQSFPRKLNRVVSSLHTTMYQRLYYIKTKQKNKKKQKNTLSRTCTYDRHLKTPVVIHNVCEIFSITRNISHTRFLGFSIYKDVTSLVVYLPLPPINTQTKVI